MKLLNPVLTPKELRLKKGTSLLLRDWNSGKHVEDFRILSEIDASTPQKSGMIHVIAQYKKLPVEGMPPFNH